MWQRLPRCPGTAASGQQARDQRAESKSLMGCSGLLVSYVGSIKYC